MEKINKQHVQLPNNLININPIAPKDLVIYLSIRRFLNGETGECYPSLSTISKKAGAAINTVRKSIDVLEKTGYLVIIKKGRKHYYKFPKDKAFEPFSFDFLDKEDLTFSEKAYLIASQQFMFKENGKGKISYSNKEIAKKINMSESAVCRINQSLVKKEYLTINKTTKINPTTGLKINEKFYHLNQLQQAIVFALTNHEERILENTNDIEKNTNDIEKLKKEIAELKALTHKNRS